MTLFILFFFFFLILGFLIWVCCVLAWNLDAANTRVFFTALHC